MITAETTRVLLLPGFDGTGELFAPLQSVLEDHVFAVTVRYRDERVFEDYVETAASLLPEGDVVLLAESFSGPVALALMTRYPARVRKAVLCATFAVSPFRSLTRLARFLPTFFFAPMPTQPMMLEKFCFDKESDPRLVEKTLSVVRSLPAGTVKKRLEVLANVDMCPLLPRIKQPVLYLQAMGDRIVAPHLSRQLVDGLGNVKVRQFDGPHLLLQSRPQECAEAIMAYISSDQQFSGDI
jgi:pimeloyl-ACP methyl ester carboxylesterase